MFRIVEADNGFIIKTICKQKIFLFFIRETEEDYRYNKSEKYNHESYHHAVQALLVDIEFGLNMNYLNAKDF